MTTPTNAVAWPADIAELVADIRRECRRRGQDEGATVTALWQATWAGVRAHKAGLDPRANPFDPVHERDLAARFEYGRQCGLDAELPTAQVIRLPRRFKPHAVFTHCAATAPID